MAMYALWLALGNNIFCKTLRASTIKEYVWAVATFIMLFSQYDPRKIHDMDKNVCPHLQAIFAELDRYDKVPHRREPFSMDMMRLAKEEAVTIRAVAPLGWRAALVDWYEVGLAAGNRKIEWAQDQGIWDPAKVHKNVYGDTYAFCLNDVRGETADGRRMKGGLAVWRARDTIRKVWITYRYQKNGDNGEERLHVRNDNPGGHCFVSAMMRILDRFITLRGSADTTTPLAIYRCERSGRDKCINGNLIKGHMRLLAAKAYGFDITKPSSDYEEVKRWSSHSLRVGACTTLHGMGFNGTSIKWLLRWKSDAFMVYLRNLTVLGIRQNEALDKAAAMPHFY